MAKKNRTSTDSIIDCACVIHGTAYDWQYVDRLYNMLNRGLPGEIRFHVYTEADRPVPEHMIKHELTEWPGVSGAKQSWWYKMQLFNPDHHTGQLLYLDLDTVIVRDMAWVTNCDTAYLWAIKDFKYLQSPAYHVINSSVMWFNVSRFSWLWQEFQKQNIDTVVKKYHGDQDFINVMLQSSQRRYFDDQYFQSYRWQCLDGGYDFVTRSFKDPGSGVHIGPQTAVVVFHGQPKPHQVRDPLIQQLWGG